MLLAQGVGHGGFCPSSRGIFDDCRYCSDHTAIYLTEERCPAKSTAYLLNFVRAGSANPPALPLRTSDWSDSLSAASAARLKEQNTHNDLSSGVRGPSCGHTATVRRYWLNSVCYAPPCVQS